MTGDRPDLDDKLNGELDALLAAYRDSLPDPEPSAAFMPGLWRQIESQRSVAYSFQRWARALVTAAAAICLLLGLLTVTERQSSPVYDSTYVEALAEENTPENLLYVGYVPNGSAGGARR